MELTKIPFEDGQKISDAYVEIGGVQYPVIKAQYQGKTPLSAFNLNKMQENTANAISDLDERVVSYRNVLVDEQALIKECGGLKLKALNKLIGKTEQEVREGYNLVDTSSLTVSTLNGITFTRNEDGSVSAKGTATAMVFFKIAIPTLTGGTTYYLSGGINSDLNVSIRSDDNVNVYATSTGNEVSYTPNSDRSNLAVYLRIANGSTVDVTLYPMLTTIPNKPYEAYGKAPTPNFPSEVKTVTGDVEVKVGNKNLFDKNNTILRSYYNEKGDIANSENWKLTNIKVNPNTTYYLSGNNYNNIVVYIVRLDKNKKFISKIGTYKETHLITTTSDTAYIGLSVADYPDNSDINTIQLEEGSVATDYVEHQSQAFPLSLGSLELCKIGDYTDYIYKNGSKWFKHSKIRKVIFNGSEAGWWLLSNNRYGLTLNENAINNYDGINGICDKLICVSQGETGTTTQENVFAINNANIYVVPNKEITSVEAFKTWLSNNNVTVYYLLATPTDTEITDTTLIAQLNALENAQLYEGITNISITGDKLTPIADLDYWTWFKGEKGESGCIYSTEEQFVGYWIDGKPLYRKIIEVTIPTSGNDGEMSSTYFNFASNVDNIVYIKGFADIYSSSTYRIFYPFWETTTGYKTFVRGEVNKSIVLVNYVKVFSGATATLTIEYTKTTD